MQGNNSKLIKEATTVFLEELQRDHYWRIHRLGTFRDLISSTAAKFMNSGVLSDKITLINLCVKSLIVQELGELDSSMLSPNKIEQLLLKESSTIKDLYSNILLKAKSKDLTDRISLPDERNYFKVLNEIGSQSFPEDNIMDILSYLLND